MLATYTNGNTRVTIDHNGTKTRRYRSDQPVKLDHPESIDVKITNYCDLGCEYCHENSTVEGEHADIEVLLNTLSTLPRGVELAIGGGNPLSHPDIIPLLTRLKSMGFIANITVNQGHLKRYSRLIDQLMRDRMVYGVGVSINSTYTANLTHIKYMSDHVVFHVIAGVHSVNQVRQLIDLFGKNTKILVLGYKDFGRGVVYRDINVDECIKSWGRHIREFVGKCTVSFDNLAIEQLGIRSLFTIEGWDRFYMGDDFCYTMYIDAVKQEYAPTSRSYERVGFHKASLLDYFLTNSYLTN